MEYLGRITLHVEHSVELQDDNRYNAGRGAHINLKRAERARVTISKIPGIAFLLILPFPVVALYFGANQVLFPAIVDNLINKTLAWEYEKKKLFLYDGVSSLSNMSFLRCAFFVALFSKFLIICRHGWY